MASLKENAQDVKSILNQMKCPALFQKTGQGNFLYLRIQQRTENITCSNFFVYERIPTWEVLMKRVNYQIKSQHKSV